MRFMTLLKQNQGFSLAELMVVVAISGIIMAGISVSFQTQKKHAADQDQVVDMQQNARAALQILTKQLRTAGYDPTSSGNFSSTNWNISFQNLAGLPSPPGALTATEVQANSTITFTSDQNEDGVLDANETFSFALYDFGEGTTDVASRDLSMTTGGGGRQLLAENIEAFGLAFAYDANGDGALDTDAAGNVIWAIDQNNDGTWDRLDTNTDGVIDINDAPVGTTNGVINAIATGTAVNPRDIRMIRISLLVKSNQQVPDFADTRAYVVGRQIITPSGLAATLGHRFQLLETSVICRNMGL